MLQKGGKVGGARKRDVGKYPWLFPRHRPLLAHAQKVILMFLL